MKSIDATGEADGIADAGADGGAEDRPEHEAEFRNDCCFVPGEVEVSLIGDLESGPRAIVSRESMDYLLLFYVVKGEVVLDLSDAGRIAVKANEVFVVFPGRVASARMAAEKNRVMFIGLRGPQMVQSVLRLGYWDLMRSAEPYRGDFLSAIVARFRESPLAGRDPQVLQMVERLLDATWQRLRNNSGKADFYDVVKALNALPFDKFTTDAAAASLDISRTKLNALMMANGFGRPGKYLARNRFMIAQAMLYFSRETTERVARRLGFGSASSFGYFFRTHCGRTPGEFRKRAIPG